MTSLFKVPEVLTCITQSTLKLLLVCFYLLFEVKITAAQIQKFQGTCHLHILQAWLLKFWWRGSDVWEVVCLGSILSTPDRWLKYPCTMNSWKWGIYLSTLQMYGVSRSLEFSIQTLGIMIIFLLKFKGCF